MQVKLLRNCTQWKNQRIKTHRNQIMLENDQISQQLKQNLIIASKNEKNILIQQLIVIFSPQSRPKTYKTRRQRIKLMLRQDTLENNNNSQKQLIEINFFEMNSRLNKNYQQENNINEQSGNIEFDLNDLNSRRSFNNILREDSINMRACFGGEFSRHYAQEDLDNPDLGNTINFWEAAKQGLFQQHVTNTLAEKSSKIQQQFPELDPNKKKGLKYLSWILNRLLRKHKYQSSQIVNACIDSVLPNQTQNAGYQKQSQNVRRRIYDAINVMTAIGLVVKNGAGQMYIRVPEKSNPVCSEEIKFMIEKDNEMNQQQNTIQNYKKMIALKQQALKNKKKHVQDLKQTISKLKYHITRNQDQNLIKTQKSNTIPPQTNQHTLKKQYINFPLLILDTKQGELTFIYYGKNHRQMKIEYKKQNNLMILTEMNILSYLYKGIGENEESNNQKLKQKQKQKAKQRNRLKIEENIGEINMDCFEIGINGGYKSQDKQSTVTNKKDKRFILSTISDKQKQTPLIIPKFSPMIIQNQKQLLPKHKQKNTQKQKQKKVEMQSQDQIQSEIQRLHKHSKIKKQHPQCKQKQIQIIWIGDLREPFHKLTPDQKYSRQSQQDYESYDSNSNY